MTINPLYRQTIEDFQYSPSYYSRSTLPGASSHDGRNSQEMLAVAEIHHFNKVRYDLRDISINNTEVLCMACLSYMHFVMQNISISNISSF